MSEVSASHGWWRVWVTSLRHQSLWHLPNTHYGPFPNIPFLLLLSGRGQVTGEVRSPRNLVRGRPVCSVMTDTMVKGTQIKESMELDIMVRLFSTMLWTYDPLYPVINHCPFSAPSITHSWLLDSGSTCLLYAMTSPLLSLLLAIWPYILFSQHLSLLASMYPGLRKLCKCLKLVQW